MVNEEKLSAVLSEFARTLITDFPIQAILDHLVERIVDVLPITSAGVTLISDGLAPRYLAASNDAALRFERLQTAIGQGPCLLAYETGEPVSAPDLGNDHRFPQFGPAAVSAGLAAVFTFPLRHGDARLGALDLYRDTVGGLDEHDMAAAQTLADVTAAYLLNAEARETARVTADHFQHNALHDPLTGLPNRLLLQERLDHAAQRANRSHTNAAVLFVDLDRFKHVNDTHGHQVGDELLRSVAQRLLRLIRSSDTLARFSGDEFVFLCEDVGTADDVEVIAKRIDDAFAKPFVLARSGITVAIAASVGMAFAGPSEDISNKLVIEADKAMYEIKHARVGTDHPIIDLRDSAGVQMADDTQLESDLRSALANDTLDVAYQPIVRASDGRIVGVEALLRWNHPHRGPVPPLEMIRVAEQSELIVEIGSWVLERACHDRSRWLGDHPGAQLDLGVNVSARQLTDPGFGAAVARVLHRTGTDPADLVLEITESVFLDDRDGATAMLAELNDLGIRLALDDFGTGYSSLSYLRQLPINILKIDGTFIADMGRSSRGRAIVAAVTDLAHELGLSVTAEGVETERQHDEVRAIGCDHAQGFFFARPASATAMGALLGALHTGPRHLPTPKPAAITAVLENADSA